MSTRWAWPTWSPDESIDPSPTRAMLTDKAWDDRGPGSFPSPRPLEYEMEWLMSKRAFALKYELGDRAFSWGETETKRHRWAFIVKW